MAIKKTQIEVLNSNIKKKYQQWTCFNNNSNEFKVSADAILSSGKQIIVSLGHVGACTLKHERSEP
jgi:hypothetical protein